MFENHFHITTRSLLWKMFGLIHTLRTSFTTLRVFFGILSFCFTWKYLLCQSTIKGILHQRKSGLLNKSNSIWLNNLWIMILYLTLGKFKLLVVIHLVFSHLNLWFGLNAGRTVQQKCHFDQLNTYSIEQVEAEYYRNRILLNNCLYTLHNI